MSEVTEFRVDDAALVITDTQQNWLPMIDGRTELIENMRTLIKLSNGFDMPVVVVEHLPWVIGSTVEPLKELLPEGTPIIGKCTYNCWLDPAFASAVEATGRSQLVFAGIETHVCLGMPALEAVRRGYDVFVPTDCTSAQAPIDRDTAFQRFWQAGIVPTTWNQLIFEGLREMKLVDGMPADERSGMVSEVWVEALPHIPAVFAYNPEADPANAMAVAE